MLFFYKHTFRLKIYFLFQDNQYDNINTWTKKKSNLFLVIQPNNFKKTALALKRHFSLAYNPFFDIVVCDTFSKKLRFSINYLFLSLGCNESVNLIVETNEIIFLPTLKTINEFVKWYEIEVWNLFGLLFNKNIELENILTTYNWNSFPFWKSFLWMKFQNIFYNDSTKKFTYLNKLQKNKKDTLVEWFEHLLSNKFVQTNKCRKELNLHIKHHKKKIDFMLNKTKSFTSQRKWFEKKNVWYKNSQNMFMSIESLNLDYVLFKKKHRIFEDNYDSFDNYCKINNSLYCLFELTTAIFNVSSEDVLYEKIELELFKKNKVKKSIKNYIFENIEITQNQIFWEKRKFNEYLELFLLVENVYEKRLVSFFDSSNYFFCSCVKQFSEKYGE